MNFYEYKVKDIRKEIAEFGKGAYGKTIFIIAYSIPLILAIIAVLIEIFGTPGDIICDYGNYLQFWILAVLFSFIAGSAYYYTELRKYMEHKAKISHKIEKIAEKVEKTAKKKTKKNS